MPGQNPVNLNASTDARFSAPSDTSSQSQTGSFNNAPVTIHPPASRDNPNGLIYLELDHTGNSSQRTVQATLEEPTIYASLHPSLPASRNNPDGLIYLELDHTGHSNQRPVQVARERTIYTSILPPPPPLPPPSRDNPECFSTDDSSSCSSDNDSSSIRFNDKPEVHTSVDDNIYSENPFEFDPIRNEVRYIFNDQINDENDMRYYSCRVLELNYSFSDALLHLRNKQLMQNILDSKDPSQYVYIIDLLYAHMAVSGHDAKNIDMSFEFVNRIAQAIIKLPKNPKNSANLILYDRLYQLLGVYSHAKLSEVQKIVETMVATGSRNDFFNFTLDQLETEQGQEVVYVPNSYFSLIKEIADTEKPRNITAGVTLSLLKSALENIKFTLNLNNDNYHYIYFSMHLSTLMNNFTTKDRNEIIDSFISDPNVSQKFKNYLRLAVKSYYNNPNIEIGDIEPKTIDYITNQLTNYRFIFRKQTYKTQRITKEEKQIQDFAKKKPQVCDPSAYRNTLYQNMDNAIFNQRIKVVNGKKPTDIKFNTANQYTSTIQVLFLYNTDNILCYLDDNLTLIKNMINHATIDECNKLMALLFNKLSNETLSGEQIRAAYYILLNISTEISNSKREKNDFIELCGKFYQVLSCLVDNLTIDESTKILAGMLASHNAPNMFKVNVSSGEKITNDYLSLLLKIAKTETSQSSGNQPATKTCFLLRSMLEYIPYSIQTKETSETQALFFAQSLADIINILPEHEQNAIISTIYNVKDISLKFKEMFYICLTNHSITIESKIYKLSNSERSRVFNKIRSMNNPTIEAIEHPGIFLSNNAVVNLIEFDNYLSLNSPPNTTSAVDQVDGLAIASSSGGATSKAKINAANNYSVVNKKKKVVTDSINNIDLSKMLQDISTVRVKNKTAYSQIIKVLSVYNCDQILDYLDKHSALFSDILMNNTLTEYDSLIELFFIKMRSSKINSTKNTSIVLHFSKLMLERLSQIPRSEERNIVYGKIYQLLSCCATTNAQGVEKILTFMLANNNNNDYFRLVSSNQNITHHDCCLHLFADVIDAQRIQNPNPSCIKLLNKFIDNIKHNIPHGSNLSNAQAFFIARGIKRVISNIPDQHKKTILDSIFLDDKVSLHFKKIFFNLLERTYHNINVSLPSYNIDEVNTIIKQTPNILVDSIDLDTQFLNSQEQSLLQDWTNSVLDIQNSEAIRNIITPFLDQDETSQQDRNFVAPIPYLLTLLSKLRSENIISFVYNDNIHHTVFEAKHARETEHEIIKLMDILHESMSDNNLNGETLNTAFRLVMDIERLIDNSSSQELRGKLFNLLGCLCNKFHPQIIKFLQEGAEYPTRLFTTSTYDDSTITNNYFPVLQQLVNLGHETEVCEILKKITPALKPEIKKNSIYINDIIPWAKNISNLISSMSNESDIKELLKYFLKDSGVSKKFRIVLSGLLSTSKNAVVSKLVQSKFNIKADKKEHTQVCGELIKTIILSPQEVQQERHNARINTRELSRMLGNRERSLISDLITEAQGNEFLHAVINDETIELLERNLEVRDNILSIMSVQSIAELQIVMEIFSFQHNRDNMLLENILETLEDISESLDAMPCSSSSIELKRGINHQLYFYRKEHEVATNKIIAQYKTNMKESVTTTFHKAIDKMNLENPEKIKKKIASDIEELTNQEITKLCKEYEKDIALEAHNLVDSKKIDRNISASTGIANRVPRVLSRLKHLVDVGVSESNTPSARTTATRQANRDNNTSFHPEPEAMQSTNNNVSRRFTQQNQVATNRNNREQEKTKELTAKASETTKKKVQNQVENTPPNSRQTSILKLRPLPAKLKNSQPTDQQTAQRTAEKRLEKSTNRVKGKAKNTAENEAKKQLKISILTKERRQQQQQLLRYQQKLLQRNRDTEWERQRRQQQGISQDQPLSRIPISSSQDQPLSRIPRTSLQNQPSGIPRTSSQNQSSRRLRASLQEQQRNSARNFGTMQNLIAINEERNQADNGYAHGTYATLTIRSDRAAEKEKQEEDKKKKEDEKNSAAKKETRTERPSHIHGIFTTPSRNNNGDDDDTPANFVFAPTTNSSPTNR